MSARRQILGADDGANRIGGPRIDVDDPAGDCRCPQLPWLARRGRLLQATRRDGLALLCSRWRRHRVSVVARLACLAGLAGLACPPAGAYESDVHFGLTRWLAIQAGFAPGQAEAIALGNQRVDGGRMDTLALTPEFACTSRSPSVALAQQQRHFPSTSPVPAAPSGRMVVPGDASARAALRSLAAMPPERALLLLGKLGEALHALQDSWAHRGAPGGAGVWGRYLSCDERLLSLHGDARGAPGTHEADLTWRQPEDLVEAARATYEVLRGYPDVPGQSRSPTPFDRLETPLRAFAAARTKAAKHAWFTEQGLRDTRFLAGISLPDGATSFRMTWEGKLLPRLDSDRSMQHDVDPSVRAFFDAALAAWLSGADLDALAARIARRRSAPRLALKLKLWIVRDHGSAAPLLHATGPLNDAKRRHARALTKDPRSLVREGITGSLVPLQAIASYATPLLPYVASVLDAEGGVPRAVALFRFVHAPHDTVGLVAQRDAIGWKLVDVVGTPDH